MKFETFYIMRLDITTEKERQGYSELISNLLNQSGVKVEKVEDWGVKPLGVRSDVQSEGHCFLLTTTGDRESARAIDNLLKVDRRVLRHMIVRLEE